jgi:MFS family permease
MNSPFRLYGAMAILAVAGATVPTPLYAIYQRAWGFSPVVLTMVFAVYALAVLAALLVLGRLSDHVGRRPVLVAAMIGQVAAMGVFATATGVAALLVARIVQGLATGAAVAAAGAGLLDVDRPKGAVVNAVAPMIGTATGTLVAGLMAQFLPMPTLLAYMAFGLVFVALTGAAALAPETAQGLDPAKAWRSLRPSLALPAQARRSLMLVLPALVAAWAVPGFYASLGPGLVSHMVGRPTPALGGLALTVMAATGALAVVATRTRQPRAMVALGSAALVVGVGITLLAVGQGLVGPFFVGAVVAGAGFGAGFQGAVAAVVSQAGAHERAGVLSVLYVVAYMSMGLPAVLGGLRASHGHGLVGTTIEYGLVVMILGSLAVAGALWPVRQRAVA